MKTDLWNKSVLRLYIETDRNHFFWFRP